MIKAVCIFKKDSLKNIILTHKSRDPGGQHHHLLPPSFKFGMQCILDPSAGAHFQKLWFFQRVQKIGCFSKMAYGYRPILCAAVTRMTS